MYTLKVMQNYNLADTKQGRSLRRLKTWHRKHWGRCDDGGGCYLQIYREGHLLDYNIKFDKGFCK